MQPRFGDEAARSLRRSREVVALVMVHILLFWWRSRKFSFMTCFPNKGILLLLCLLFNLNGISILPSNLPRCDHYGQVCVSVSRLVVAIGKFYKGTSKDGSASSI